MSTLRQSVKNNFFQFYIPSEQHRGEIGRILNDTFYWSNNCYPHHEIYIIDVESKYISTRPTQQCIRSFTTIIVDDTYMQMLELLPSKEAKLEFLFCDPLV